MFFLDAGRQAFWGNPATKKEMYANSNIAWDYDVVHAGLPPTAVNQSRIRTTLWFHSIGPQLRIRFGRSLATQDNHHRDVLAGDGGVNDMNGGIDGARPPLRRGLTFWSFFPVFGVAIVLFASYCLGAVSWWLLCAASLPLYWYCYVVSHDAVHGAAHWNKTLNSLVGWISTMPFGLPFSLMRRAHLGHHAGEGKHGDVEQFAYRLEWRLPFGLLFGNWFFYSAISRCSRRERLAAAATLVAILTLVLIWPRVLFFGWFVPMQIVVCFGMVTNVYLPHGPFAEWTMKHIPFLTGYHEDHHAKPQYPWHQICQRAVRSSRITDQA